MFFLLLPVVHDTTRLPLDTQPPFFTARFDPVLGDYLNAAFVSSGASATFLVNITTEPDRTDAEPTSELKVVAYSIYDGQGHERNCTTCPIPVTAGMVTIYPDSLAGLGLQDGRLYLSVSVGDAAGNNVTFRNVTDTIILGECCGCCCECDADALCFCRHHHSGW